MRNIFFISFSIVLLFVMGSCTKTGKYVQPTTNWEYENPNWGSAGYGDCNGTVQSPININTEQTIKATLSDITFNYNPFQMKIVDDGHTIQVNGAGSNAIVVNGVSFDFKQFHFHHQSEHTVNGKASPMELHLVHEDPLTKNITVLGIMLEEGADNPFIQAVWENIPTTKKNEVTTAVTLNLADILPADTRYYTYTGSLTTPPCSQGLQWILFKESIKLSRDQIDAFARLYENNARPIQPTNNRQVLEKI